MHNLTHFHLYLVAYVGFLTGRLYHILNISLKLGNESPVKSAYILV